MGNNMSSISNPVFKTADLLDDNEEKALQVALPGFISYGGRSRFSGQIVTIKTQVSH